ncbi:unnamed protein product [Hermetia illucens]|uniref:CRAL-TRIO domain-containing protein n=3 Tax=Hermetia illucens TaxID=343691 RepID=A0A7R8YZW1_HERIL|nr:unnamed protein product [Hermetia illucens]
MSSSRPMNELLAKKAREELNEDPNTIEESVQLLKEWTNKLPHIRVRTDSRFLLIFLRANKFSVESAKKKIEGYYTMRSAVPELFKNRNVDDPKMQEIFKLGVGLIFPKTNGVDGPRISLIRAGSYDPNKYNIKDVIKAGTFAGDIQLLEDDNITIAGQIEIMDLANVTLGHMLQMDAVFFKKLAAVGETGTPIRHKGLHFINTPPGFDTFFNLFKSFLGDKSKTRLFSHGHNIESLYNYVSKSLLPAEYGGGNSSIPEMIDYWYNKILSYRDYFKEEEEYGIVERYRKDIQKQTEDSLFGVDGTFRKLCID